MTDIDCALRRMGVSLAQNEEIGNQYIVTINVCNVGDVKTLIPKSFYEMSYDLKAVHKSYPSFSYDKYSTGNNTNLRIYQTGNGKDIWIVGEKETVTKAITNIETSIRSENIQNSGSDAVKTLQDVQVIDIPLTQAEQALIYLHRLWDTKHFKTDQTSIEKDTRYLLTI